MLVDDIIITRNSSTTISKLIKDLNNEFVLKDLSILNYFLGVQVTHTKEGGLHLSQAKYIKNLLKKAQMGEAKPMTTPMVTGQKLTTMESDDFDNPSL